MGILRNDITGKVFGKLTVERYTEEEGLRKYVVALCACGTRKRFQATKIATGYTKSCGCARSDNAIHGLWNSRTYAIWQAMKGRCTNPKANQFKDYGGRGIRFQEDWGKFKNFLRDMGECPAAYSIERKDVNGNYCKANCIWIPKGHQMRNTSRTTWIIFEGQKYCAQIACDKASISGNKLRSWIFQRKGNGQSAQEIFEELVFMKGKRLDRSYVLFQGEEHILSCACRLAGVSSGCVTQRARQKNESIQEAFDKLAGS